MQRTTLCTGALVALALPIAAPAAVVPPPAPAAGRTVVATAGPSAGCDFDDLQAAIDFLSASVADRRVLQIERGAFEDVALTVDADRIEIVGGFESCGDPQPGDGRSTLVGTSSDRVLSIEPGPGPRSVVLLANLRIEDGAETFGGGIRVLGAVDVVLDRVLVIDNLATVGGGVYLADGPPELGGPSAPGGGPTLTLLDGSGVNGNQALEGFPSKGGGIACVGTGRVVAEAGSGVVFNEAHDGGSGGGIFVDGCELSITGPVTIGNNRAGRGGGIAAVGSRVLLRGTAEGQVRVINNTADGGAMVGVGGGIAMLGDGAELIADNARIDDNRALPEVGGGVGGGLVVLDGAVATLDRTLGPSCPGGAECSSLSSNRAGDSAAARVSTGGRLEIRRTAVHGNVALEAVLRSASDSASEPGLLRVVGSTLTANSGRTLLDIEARSRLELVASSAAGNFGLDRVIRGEAGDGAEPAEVIVESSIVYETAPGVEIFDLEPLMVFDPFCVVVPEEAVEPDGPVPAGDVATTADPQFVDLGQRDLHLGPQSPALDVCPGPEGVPTDIDLDLRGHDLPEVPDRLPQFVFDAGADEIGPPAPVFADGFESGDLSAWSGAVALGGGGLRSE